MDKYKFCFLKIWNKTKQRVKFITILIKILN
jgi:hypothetical protein